MYDYFKAMRRDIRDYIEYEINFNDYDSLDEMVDFLSDELWTVDSVTGNGSGSYTFSRANAKEYVSENFDLLREALKEFCCTDAFADHFFNEDWEWCDVVIRCYVLNKCLLDVCEEYEDEFDEEYDEDNE